MLSIREKYLVFPNFTQNFWTWLTGKALPNQKPMFVFSPLVHFVTATAFCFGGFGLSLAAFYGQVNILWLFAGWAMVIAGGRKLAAVILHQCVHRMFSGNIKLDNFTGELVTTLLCTQDAMSYRSDHFGLHHRALTFATQNDPIVKFLSGHGMTHDMTKKELYAKFFTRILSPVFHAKFFYCRLVFNFVTCGPWRRAASVAFWTAMISAAVLAPNGLLAFVLVYAVPVILLYQISAFVEICSEHAWLVPDDPNQKVEKKYYHVFKSWGRFCGSVPPTDIEKPLLRAIRWVGFWIATVFYHLPVRLFILVGDLPQHDFHHRHPSEKDWVISAYARQRDIDNGHEGWPPYREFWGLHNAIEHVFSGMTDAIQKNKISDDEGLAA